MSALREELHMLIDKIADAIEGAEATERKRAKPVRRVPKPLAEVNDLDRARAKRVLRKQRIFVR